MKEYIFRQGEFWIYKRNGKIRARRFKNKPAHEPKKCCH